MPLTGLHCLLTYRCTRECDHCFVFGSPRARGAFSTAQIQAVMDEGERLGTVDEVYFEGGEPFLIYDLMLEGVRAARRRGWTVGIVTNGYWATTEERAERLLRPLAEVGVADLSVSQDDLHGDPGPAAVALRVADRLGIGTGSIAIDAGTLDPAPGKPVTGGRVKCRGRAVESLADTAAGSLWDSFDHCPYERLDDPGRVHIDHAGYVHLCQGLAMGNCHSTPLSTLVREYRPEAHPVVGPLLAGGPAELARTYGLPGGRERYADACHLCYLVRKGLRERFPALLGPGQVYGEIGAAQ